MLVAYFCQLVLDKYWKKFTVLPNNKPEMCVILYVPDPKRLLIHARKRSYYILQGNFHTTDRFTCITNFYIT